MEIVFAARTI